MSVIRVDRSGLARLLTEAEACADLLRAAAPPERCGPEMPVAPARGAMEAFQPREMVMTDAGNPVSRRAGYLGRDAARVADAFDRMTLAAQKAHAGAEVRALRAHDAAVRAGKAFGAFRPQPFDAPFTHGQVSVARDYLALSERCSAAGLSCVSMETRGGGSGGNGGREEAIFADLQRLRAFHRRIGDGLAKEVRRIRPSVTGGPRRAITVRRLVDMVCLGNQTISEVLEAHRWAANACARKGLREALRGALDRMQGYDLARPQNLGLTPMSAEA